jgi:hypothetical protein
MSVLEDLIVVASVGTSRKEPALPPSDDALGETFGLIVGAAPEGRLLGGIAIAAQYETCGRLTAESSAEIESAGEETLPPASPRAGQLLSQILAMPNGPTKEHLMREWLGAAARSMKRVPHRNLPALFDYAESNRRLRSAIAEAAGARGAWLMRLNPRWRFAVVQEEDPEALWATGTGDQRLAAITSLRATDTRRACELIASTWAEDSADDRSAFVAAMKAGLSAEDEAFLESALDDRSKQVRAAAAELLASLPGSAYVWRMIERAETLLKLQPVRGRKAAVIEISLPPDKLDPPWARDGIPEKPQGKMGRRQEWLAQVVGSVPMTHWSQKWSLSAEKCVAAAMGEFAEALLAGWNRAAQRHPDSEWIRALLRAAAVDQRGPLSLELLNVLPAGQQQAMAVKILESRATDAEVLYELIHTIRFQLDMQGAAALFRRIESPGKAQLMAYSAVLSTVLREAAVRVPPEFYDELAKRTGSTILEANRKALDESLQILLIRRDIQREFQS